MAIRLFITGGTFDKDYDEISGRLLFRDTHLQEMLQLGRCRLDVSVRTLMMVDSLEMTDADRQLVLENCRSAAEERIVITHGTDTMIDTARVLGEAVAREDDRPHRRDGPVRLRQLRRPVQPRQRPLVRPGAAARRLRRHERPLLPLGRRRKNRQLGVFETKS